MFILRSGGAELYSVLFSCISKKYTACKSMFDRFPNSEWLRQPHMPPSTNVNIKQIYPLTHTPNSLTYLTSGKYHDHSPDK